MSNASNITLFDAAATPVAHVFKPTGPDRNGIFQWEEIGVAASPIGNYRITAEFVRAPVAAAGSDANNRVNRVKLQLSLPTLEVVGGTDENGYPPPPRVAYILRAAGGEYILPDRSSELERKTLRKMNSNLQNDPQIIEMVESLIPRY